MSSIATSPEEPEDNDSKKKTEAEKALEISLILKELTKDSPNKLKSLINKLGGQIKSTETYYSQKAALGIKPIVDAMILDGQDREFLFEDYPRWSHNTVRQKLESGLKFLVQEMDDTQFTYAKWREGVRVCILKNRGVVFEYRRGTSCRNMDGIEFKAYVVKDGPDVSIIQDQLMEEQPIDDKWRDSLIEWIKNSKNGQEYDRRNLTLNEEDKLFIRNICPEPFIVRVRAGRVKILNNMDNSIEVDERVVII